MSNITPSGYIYGREPLQTNPFWDSGKPGETTKYVEFLTTSQIETVKDKIDSIGFIRFTLRNDDIEVYRFNNKYYSDRAAINEIDLVDLMNIYKVNIIELI